MAGVVANVRAWRDYEASVARLWALEDQQRAVEAPDEPIPMRVPGALEWWSENFSLLRDQAQRGYPMVLQTYEQAGLYLAPGELPDHLTVVLEYASTQPPTQARAFLRELTHILQAIFSALLRRESPYASVLAAVLELAGEKAQAVKIPDEPGLDETWEEPAAFGGCSTQGQASPGQPQPIQIVRAAARQASTQPGASV